MNATKRICFDFTLKNKKRNAMGEFWVYNEKFKKGMLLRELIFVLIEK